MATWGALNNANNDGGHSPNGTFFSGGQFGATSGTLTDVHMYVNERWAPGTWRFAIYQGGASANPTGASLIYDSGALSGDLTGTLPGWRSAVTDLGLTPSGSLAASTWTWLYIKSQDEITILVCSGADAGNLSVVVEADTSISAVTSTAFPATISDAGSSGFAEAFKFYLTFSAAASGLNTKIAQYY